MLKNGFFTLCHGLTGLFFVTTLGIVNANTPQNKAINSPKRALNLYANFTIEDLKAAHDYIRDNSPVTDRASFLQWLNPGYKKAIDMAQHVTSLGGYTAVMRYYANGFHNHHLRPIFLATQYQYNWPRFLIAKKSKDYEVIHNDNENLVEPFSADDANNNILKIKPKILPDNEIPPIGAKLVECDGLSPEQLMIKNVAPFYSTPTKSDNWDLFSHFILIDTDNPWFFAPTNCKFNIAGHIEEYSLDWIPIQSSILLHNSGNYAFGKPPNFSIASFGTNGVWISLPIFYPGKFIYLYAEPLKEHTPFFYQLEENHAITSAQERIKKLSGKFFNKKLIVFDLRGNRGGFPDPAYEMLENIYGTEYNQWLKNGSKKLKLHKNTKIYLLTDGRCASGCWIFVNKLKKIDNVIQIGRPTDSNDLCRSPHHFELPSKLSTIGVPMQCNLQLEKEFINTNGVPAIPKYRFDGNMADTKALKKWVATL